VSDHAGWAALVTVVGDGKDALVDRRRVELVDADLPKLPHHHDAQGLPLGRALALIERVRVSADQHAQRALDAVATAVSSRIRGIAIRRCPPLPPTVAERLADYRAQNVADTVMYRHALAGAAEARGWVVHWYDAKKVLAAAAAALNVDDFEAHFQRLKAALGPPWGQDQRLAMAAAIAASRIDRAPAPGTRGAPRAGATSKRARR
jgi:hypothetical protein